MTSKDAILASMDVLSALEMTSGDVIVDAKINALNNLHSQKVRALMKSINTLKDQVALMKAQSKDHRIDPGTLQDGPRSYLPMSPAS